ncbi:right-handed parallel beta-helix repeat-containing protein [Aeromicrobium sp.]|uniref:right-handed parallel beta-helix repeat-containing protein n=1 Tax=Aeromicrobium sp. TaxID=1871063 RepID=UPI0019830FF9|nr:right-handed parallel beta-helix repeat-containing protein [Aeromicrobium sp.]MBC7631437.1 right-handed parallel beta-helix repeat-containing protein [Aeromicrobium sp.]
MRKLRHASRAMITAAAGLLVAGLVPVGAAHADTAGPITFESSGFSTGSVNGQNGWSSTGAYDQGVVASSRYTSFGSQSLRISSAVTSGSFSDQTFSPQLASPAGESPGLLPHFDATLQVGTTQDGEQTGLHLTVSPDNGSGARMSYLRLEDQTNGVHVFFDDVTDPRPVGTAATFNESDIATLDRTSAHTLRFSIDFFTGPGNDVVKIFIDGALRATGTTWENYYRYDPEQAPSNTISPTSSLLLREGGTAAPGTAGAGFLVDNVSLASTATTTACGFSTSGTTMTLLANCTTDHTILVPDGFTLEGAGHTITAIDPTGGHFTGAVVTNAGASANVHNLVVTAANLATVCDAFPASLAGIRLDGASGAITGDTVTGLQQGSAGDGCQEGNAIEVRNTAGVGTPAVSVTGNTTASYQKTGVLVKGQVSAVVTGNTVTGYGPVNFIAQNGIQVSFGASAQVADNTISNNFYTPKSNDACGLLIYQAGGVKVGKNTFSGNEKNLCNVARGGTFGGV